MRLLDYTTSRALGVDIGATSVKVAEMADGPGGPRLLHAAVIPIKPGRAEKDPDVYASMVAAGLRQAVRESGSRANRAACSLAGTVAMVRYFRFPKLSDNELAGAIRFEAEQVIPYDISEVDLDFELFRDDVNPYPDECAGVFVVAPKTMVRERLKLVRNAGLTAAIVDTESLALANCFLALSGLDDDETTAILNIGCTRSSFAILRRRGFQFCRDVAVGVGQAAEDGRAAEMETDGEPSEPGRSVQTPVRQLASELKQSFNYYKTQQRVQSVDRICLCGGASRVPDVADLISEEMGIPVQLWNPLHHVANRDAWKDKAEEIGPSLAIAVGLASRKDV